MTSVTIGLSTTADSTARMRRAFESRAEGNFIAFASPELLWQVITPKRWNLLRAMTGAGPVSVQEVARRIEREVKSAQADIEALVKAGILDRTEDGLVVFPYDEVHVDFVLRAA
ncbi:MAG: DNA-binding protein [Stellaceae bacterium]